MDNNYKIIFDGFDKAIKKYRERNYTDGIESRILLIKSLHESFIDYGNNDEDIISEFKRIENELKQIEHEKNNS